MEITKEFIEQYLADIKKSIRKKKYRIDMNRRRQRNSQIYTDYVIDEAKSQEILLSLEPEDFSEVRQNEHKGYEHEYLFVFGKDVELLERFGENTKLLHLYIKFNKLQNLFIIVISFHEQVYPLEYPFKAGTDIKDASGADLELKEELL